MKLVIVESPAKAKTINKYLGSDYKVIASLGHIRDLPSKDGSVLPEEDFSMKYEIISKSSQYVKNICDSAKNASEIYLATDPDREGESISWHIVEVLKQKKSLKTGISIKRIVFSEITKKAVTQAIKDARDIDQNLVDAQQARRALDYLVGFKLSPVLWRKLPGSKSAGRVQSVALRLICDREQEIERFKKQEYWTIKAEMFTSNSDRFLSNLIIFNNEKLEKFSLTNEADATKVVNLLNDLEYFVESIEKKQQKRQPPAPFTTSSLQQEGSRKLGFSTKKTMQLAQKLYEGLDVGGETLPLITYMRTDGVSLSEDAIQSTRQWILQNLGDKYLPESPRIYKAKAKNAQEAHEAIRPVDSSITPDSLKGKLEEDYYKLYDLIWKRTIACQVENVILDTVAVNIADSKKQNIFRANGSMVVFDGFYRIYQEGIDDSNDTEENKLLPIMSENEAISLENLNKNQHFTEPPPRYSEASLVKKLEELGIGRPSTYSSIISVLQERDYVRLDKKRFIPEDRGLIVTIFLTDLFPKYVEYNFTAQLENELDEISDGKVNWKDILRNFWGGFNQTIANAMEQKMSDIITNIDTILAPHLFPEQDGKDSRKCPNCENGNLSLKFGKFGPFVGCSNYPECNFTKQLSNNTNDQENVMTFEKTQDIVLGVNPEGEKILIKTGPYGPYIQLGDAIGKAKPQRVSIPIALVKPEEITLEKALWFLRLPLNIGDIAGEDVLFAIGKFGPYVKYKGKFYSIPKSIDIFNMDIASAKQIIESSIKS